MGRFIQRLPRLGVCEADAVYKQLLGYVTLQSFERQLILIECNYLENCEP